MKLTNVIPICKAKGRESLGNDRPISLLSNISNILGKVVHTRLYSMLCRYDILYNNQYVFRPNHYTTHAITEFTTNVLNSMDQREHCLSVFLDLSKAFDTLRKRSHYGIRDKTLEWFGNYLLNRRQYVSYKCVHSKLFRLDYGFPQGSVLGPVLLILSSNDVPKSIAYRSVH